MILPAREYRRICRVMPIACVDLLVTDPRGRVLLLKRRNAPAAGQWWFPGGRVLYGELREAAALRKLREETGFSAWRMSEMYTADMLFAEDAGGARHGITTLFHVRMARAGRPKLDAQSREARWRAPREWLAEGLHPFVAGVLARARRR